MEKLIGSQTVDSVFVIYNTDQDWDFVISNGLAYKYSNDECSAAYMSSTQLYLLNEHKRQEIRERTEDVHK